MNITSVIEIVLLLIVIGLEIYILRDSFKPKRIHVVFLDGGPISPPTDLQRLALGFTRGLVVGYRLRRNSQFNNQQIQKGII